MRKYSEQLFINTDFRSGMTTPNTASGNQIPIQTSNSNYLSPQSIYRQEIRLKNALQNYDFSKYKTSSSNFRPAYPFKNIIEDYQKLKLTTPLLRPQTPLRNVFDNYKTPQVENSNCFKNPQNIFSHHTKSKSTQPNFSQEVSLKSVIEDYKISKQKTYQSNYRQQTPLKHIFKGYPQYRQDISIKSDNPQISTKYDTKKSVFDSYQLNERTPSSHNLLNQNKKTIFDHSCERPKEPLPSKEPPLKSALKKKDSTRHTTVERDLQNYEEEDSQDDWRFIMQAKQNLLKQQQQSRRKEFLDEKYPKKVRFLNSKEKQEKKLKKQQFTNDLSKFLQCRY